MRRIYVERRIKRTSSFVEALGYYMESAAREHDIKAIVLADMDGLVISEYHADRSLAPEEVAAFCPLIIRVGGNCYDGRMKLDPGGSFSMLLFLYHDQPLYLCAIGGNENVCDVLLEMMEGVHRILGN